MTAIQRANPSGLPPYLFPAQGTPPIDVASFYTKKYEAQLPCSTSANAAIGYTRFRVETLRAIEPIDSFQLFLSAYLEKDSGVACISVPAAQSSATMSLSSCMSLSSSTNFSTSPRACLGPSASLITTTRKNSAASLFSWNFKASLSEAEWGVQRWLAPFRAG